MGVFQRAHKSFRKQYPKLDKLAKKYGEESILLSGSQHLRHMGEKMVSSTQKNLDFLYALFMIEWYIEKQRNKECGPNCSHPTLDIEAIYREANVAESFEDCLEEPKKEVVRG